jgi:enoyl-CoA hydratase
MQTRTETYIQTETQEGVLLIRLHRPDKLNAICFEMMSEVLAALQEGDKDSNIGCFVLTGSDKAFAAGADIEEMARASAEQMLSQNPFAVWDAIRRVKKPIIAAVSGYALGGGCELAMLCDTIIASETAVFSQPEVNIGIIPGAGGTQRLIRAVGKAKAMAMILSGERLVAADALNFGLVAEVHPLDTYLTRAMGLAQDIAQKPRLAVQMAKELLYTAYECPLDVAIQVERQAFYALFDSADKKEGMAAFLEKRPPQFSSVSISRND